VQRDGDEQVEIQLASVVRRELATDAIDLAAVELGHQLDLLLGQQARQVLRGDRLRERAVERRRVSEFRLASDTALVQVPVGEEDELERSDRTLDRHVDQVHEQAAAVELLERSLQRGGAFHVVEGEDTLVPAGTGHAFGLLRLQTYAGGDDEHVVLQSGSVVEQDFVALGRDLLDLALVEHEAASQLVPTRPHDLIHMSEAEGDEEQAGLVHVPVVTVDDVDLRLVRVEAARQPVGGHRAASPGAEDDDLLLAHDVPPAATSRR
jgi:hypothetical protein